MSEGLNLEDLNDATGEEVNLIIETLARIRQRQAERAQAQAEAEAEAAKTEPEPATTARTKLVTKAAAARMLGMSRATVSKMIDRGDIRTVQVMTQSRVPMAEIERLAGGIAA